MIHSMMIDFNNLPDFDSLPHVEGMPQGCTWGIFDKPGTKDHLGCFNILTPEVKREALKEARDGISISLNWNLNGIAQPGFGRKKFEHIVKDGMESPFCTHSFDDEVNFDTQGSSQWDSLVHYAHQPSGLCYNGLKPTKEVLSQSVGKHDKPLPTLDHWHQHGGLVGRGVLLDFAAYAAAKNISFDCFDAYGITVADLEAVIAHQGTKLKYGDILLVRTGYTERLGAANAEEQSKLLGTHKAAGVRGNMEAVKWIWNHHFSAVAGDAVAFETLPPLIESEGNRTGRFNELVLHNWLIGLFGMTIGELWDLKALSEHCAKVGRYEFLLTSAPLNFPGAVASPPNALAIF